MEESRVAGIKRDAEAERNHHLKDCRRCDVHRLLAMIAEPMFFAHLKDPVRRAVDEGRWVVFLRPRHRDEVHAIRQLGHGGGGVCNGVLRKLGRCFFESAPGLGPAPGVEDAVVETRVAHPGGPHGSISSCIVAGRTLIVDIGGVNSHCFEKGGSIVDERIVVEPLFFVVSFGVVEARKMRRPRVAGFTVGAKWRRAVVATLCGIRLRPTKRGAKIERAEGQRRIASERVEISVGKLARSRDQPRVGIRVSE